MLIRCFGLVFLLAASGSLAAQISIGHFEGLSRRLWEARDGLPNQTVRTLAQTRDGSLWIGTEGGLVRFDGVRFVSCDDASIAPLAENGVNALLVAANGDLWIGTEGGGVVVYRDQQFVPIPTHTRQASIFVRSVYQDHNGHIWVGADQGLFRYQAGELVRVDNASGVPSLFVRCILEDRQGHLWVGGTDLLELSDSHLVHQYHLPNGPARSVILSMLVDHQGALWVGMLSGLYKMNPQGTLQRAYGLTSSIAALTEGPDGTLWIGSGGQGLFYARNGALSQLPASELPSRAIRTTFYDSEGNLWLGTQAGLVRLSPTPTTIVHYPGGADAEFETLMVDRDQSIWVAASSKLFHITNGIAAPYQFPGLPKLRVRTIMRDHKGELWIGTDGTGLLHLRSNGTVERFSVENGFPNDFVRCILESSDGSVWAGTDGGLAHVSAGKTRTYNPSSGLAYFSVLTLFEDRSHTLWVGTSRGLSRIIAGAIVRDDLATRLAGEAVWNFSQDSSGIVWIGTSNGLYGASAGSLRHLTTAEGLVSNKVLQTLPDGHGNLWLVNPSSISRVRESDLDLFSAGKRVRMDLYEDANNLDSVTFYSGMQPEGGIAANGDVWLASSKGAVRITPAKIRQITPSAVAIEEIHVDNQLVAPGSPLTLRPATRSLEISYAGIHLSAQGGLQYRYQMQGLEPWIEAGARRTAYYTHLPAGTYHFRVQAYEIGNPSAVTEAVLVVVQQPPIYATAWFLILCAVSILLAVFLFYRLRMGQLRRQFKAVNAERLRLAREMHDTIIQGCVGVSTLLEAAQELEQNNTPLRQNLLGLATEQVRNTIESARSAIWAMRNLSTSDGDIAQHFLDLVRKMQLEFDHAILCEIIGTPFQLGEDATHELLMVVKEALTNALSHAQASVIQLLATFEKELVSIEISDNGKGFNLEEASKRTGHFGLIGMMERTKLLGGTLTIESSAENGTTLRIRIPRTQQRTS